MCASAIQQARICKLIYINDSNNVAATDISKRILNDTNLNHSVEIIKYSIEDDILNKFFKKIRSNVSRETLE
jgi:tRNA(Arg) A34 adenosine deaminase TadA